MATGNTDPAVVANANSCLRGMEYVGGKLRLIVDGVGVTQQVDGTLDAVSQTTAEVATVYGGSSPSNWPYPGYPSCANAIRSTCAGDLVMDRSLCFDGSFTYEEDILLETETTGRAFAAKNLTVATQFSKNPPCLNQKRLVFQGVVDFHTSFRSPSSEVPKDANGAEVVETAAEMNRRTGFPGYHVAAAVYLRDNEWLRGYSFQADDGGHVKSDDASFFARTVVQSIPIIGYVRLNDSFVLDLHVAPAVWMRDTGPIIVSSKVKVRLTTIQMELR